MEFQGAREWQRKKIRKLSCGDISNDNRSLSEGSKLPLKNKFPTRESSSGGVNTTPDVRCACQYYQSQALLPARVNLVGARAGNHHVNSAICRYVC